MLKGSRLLMASISCVFILALVSGQGCPPCLFNTPPVANAGPDQEVEEPGIRVALDGLGSSDGDGDPLRYFWQVVRGPEPVVIDDAETATPSFTPPVGGVYELSLRVSDDCDSDLDTVLISVGDSICTDSPGYPEARARTDRASIPGGSTGNLNGSTSVDPCGLPLTFFWRQTSGPQVDIANPYLADTTFTAPMVTETTAFAFELTASNGTKSDTDTVTITVPGSVVECIPTAEAGPDQTVNVGGTVTLDGSGSLDSCDLTLEYSWSQMGGEPTVALLNPQAVKPTFTAPQAQAILTFELKVSNGSATATDTVIVAVGDDPDGDGIQNDVDNCPAVANSNQANADGDAAGDACDGCPNDPNKTDPGVCGCGVADIDADADGVADCGDDCPGTPAGQAVDANGCSCSQGDADADGVDDCADQCPNTPAGEVVDNNGCSCSQKDSDGDGVNDCDDQCLNTPAGELADANGCSCSQKDTDSDGVNDCNDQCPNTPAGQAVDGQGCPVDSARTDTITLISGTLNGQSLNTNRPSITVEAGQTLTGTLNWRVYQDFDSGAVYPAVRTHTWATNHAASYVVLDDWVTRNEVPKTIADSINLTAPTTPGTYYIVTGGWPVTNAACIAANDYPTATFGDGDDLADQPGSVLETSWDGVGQYTNVSGFLGSYTQPMAGYAVRMIVQAPTPDGMVLIPAGTFQMGNALSATGEGDTDELPVHVVNLNAFRIDPYEATNQDYADALNWAMNQGGLISVPPLNGVVYRSGGTSIPYCNTTASEYDTHITWDGASFGVTPGKENHPMVRVTWWGAAAYANWRSVMSGRQPCYSVSTWNCDFSKNGYRLPTEAEWEKAARGGVTGRRFPWSDTDTIQHTRANYYSSSSYSYDTGPTRGYHPLWGVGGYPWTSPVGFFNGELRQKVNFNWPGSQATYQTTNGANGYGLYDMAGNVWEWCNDWYSSTYYSTPEASQPNPRGPLTATPYRAIRGGNSWGHAADWCRVADRVGGNGPDAWSSHVGFRLARNSE